MINVYVDGSFKNNLPSYGFVIVDSDEVIIYEDADIVNKKELQYISSRQIVGEIASVLNALQWLLDNGYETASIHYDYAGIEHWADGSWKAKKPVSKYYKERLLEYESITVDFVKVKAHSGNKWNEYIDDLARGVHDS